MASGDSSAEKWRTSFRELSERLVEAQREIRILQAVKWSAEVERDFLASGGRELPRLGVESYRALPFDPKTKRGELRELASEVERRFGGEHPAAELLLQRVREYRRVVDLLEARGTPAFSRLSQELYGSTAQSFYRGGPPLAQLGSLVGELVDDWAQTGDLPDPVSRLDSEAAVSHLRQRLDHSFGEVEPSPRVLLSDGISSDAAAGSDYIKLRREATFSKRELRLLEAHEGWVHLGTNYNGRRQSLCTFLSKGPPSVTVTQEGLAILVEVLTLRSHSDRLRRLGNRVRAIEMAEQGADFLEVFRFFREQLDDDRLAYSRTHRVFRGSLPTLGPFTKDLSYTRGFVEVFGFVRLAVQRAELDKVRLLFVGKIHLGEMVQVERLVEDGWVDPPSFLPEIFRDLHGLAAWMAFSTFLGGLDRVALEAAQEALVGGS